MGQSQSSAPQSRPKDSDLEMSMASIDQDNAPQVNAVPDAVKAHFTEKQRERWDGQEDAIQPHTDEGDDAYFLGDAYEGITCAEEWRLPNPGPYLRWIKHLALTLPHFAYLAHWMEVSAAPPKWKYLKYYPERCEQRAKKTKACLIDYNEAGADEPQFFDDAEKLKTGISQTADGTEVRLIVIEDLCRDVVEMLGLHFDIDPLFFLSHIGDYLFHNTRDPWVELPSLDVDARQSPHLSLSYLRARYFSNEKDFLEAERQSGLFNVLRRLDSDRSRKRFQDGLLDRPGASVALGRAKTSLWVKPRVKGAKEPITAILLVDPTVKTEKSYPLWGGYRPWGAAPSIKDWQANPDALYSAPKRESLFDDIVYWSIRMTPEDLQLVKEDGRNIAIPMFRLVIADWLNVLKYMTSMLAKIEWQFEKPHWGNPADIDDLLKLLSPWRRNVGYYQTMISEAIARLFKPAVRPPLHASQPGSATLDSTSMSMWSSMPGYLDNRGISSLWVDFQNVKRQMDENQARIKSIEATATNSINIEESRRAVEENRRSVKQNKNLARVTVLATIFIPLNFTSSFLSISGNISVSQNTFWLFFAIGVPLTLLVGLFIYVTHPTRMAVYSAAWKRFKEWLPAKMKNTTGAPLLPITSADSADQRPSLGERQKTKQWFKYRTETNFKSA